MKLCLSGFDNDIEIMQGKVSTLELHNSVLFARIAQSLVSCLSDEAMEPYLLYGDDNEKLNPTKEFLFVFSPLDLPIEHKLLSGQVATKVEKELMENEEIRLEIEMLNNKLRSSIFRTNLSLNSDYSFAIEWNIKRYLKSFGFGLSVSDNARLLDKVISFLKLAADVSLKQVVVFIGLKNFLSKIEFDEFCEQVFFLNLKVLLLEHEVSSDSVSNEIKYVIDQDLLES